MSQNELERALIDLGQEIGIDDAIDILQKEHDETLAKLKEAGYGPKERHLRLVRPA
jgi:hypothetical protein